MRLKSETNNDHFTRIFTHAYVCMWVVTRYTFFGAKNISNRSYKEKGNTLCARHTSSIQTKASERVRVTVCIFVLLDKQYVFFLCSAARKIGMDMLFCPYVSCSASPGTNRFSSNLVLQVWGPDIVIDIASRYG